MKKIIGNDRSACSKSGRPDTGAASAYLFVRKLHEGGLVTFVTRPDGQQGVALTSKGQAAMWAIDGGDDEHPAYDD